MYLFYSNLFYSRVMTLCQRDQISIYSHCVHACEHWTGPSLLAQLAWWVEGFTTETGYVGQTGVHQCAMKHRPPNGGSSRTAC